MKRIFFLLSIFITTVTNAQTSTQFQGGPNVLTINRGYFKADSAITIVIRDTIGYKGNLVIRPQDNSLYWRKDSTQAWSKAASLTGANAAITWSDTLTRIATKKNLRDTAAFLRVALASKQDTINRISSMIGYTVNDTTYPTTRAVTEFVQTNVEPIAYYAYYRTIDSFNVSGNSTKYITLYRHQLPALVDSFKDNDTKYTSGFGLMLTDTTFRVDTSVIATPYDISSSIANQNLRSITTGTNRNITNNVLQITGTNNLNTDSTGLVLAGSPLVSTLVHLNSGGVIGSSIGLSNSGVSILSGTTTININNTQTGFIPRMQVNGRLSVNEAMNNNDVPTFQQLKDTANTRIRYSDTNSTIQTRYRTDSLLSKEDLRKVTNRGSISDKAIQVTGSAGADGNLPGIIMRGYDPNPGGEVAITDGIGGIHSILQGDFNNATVKLNNSIVGQSLTMRPQTATNSAALFTGRVSALSATQPTELTTLQQVKDSLLLYERISNKATDLNASNNILYPTTKAAKDNDISGISVTGTSTKTITLSRPNGAFIATFQDDNTTYTAGYGINMSGTQINVDTTKVVPIDNSGKISFQYLPSTLLINKGVWSAATNTPTLTDGIGTNGWVYLSNDSGIVDFGTHIDTFSRGDWAIYNGSIWQKSINSNAVVTVNGKKGVVMIGIPDIPGLIDSLAALRLLVNGKSLQDVSLVNHVRTVNADGASWLPSGGSFVVFNRQGGHYTHLYSTGSGIGMQTSDNLGGLAGNIDLQPGGGIVRYGGNEVATKQWALSQGWTTNQGTVTSVAMNVPTGLTISGSPINTSGTLDLGLQAGYSIPTTANQTNWSDAYNKKILSASFSGISTKTLTLPQQDGGSIQASFTDLNTGDSSLMFTNYRADTMRARINNDLNGKEPSIAAGTTSQYWRGDKTWQNINWLTNETDPLSIRKVSPTQANLNFWDGNNLIYKVTANPAGAPFTWGDWTAINVARDANTGYQIVQAATGLDEHLYVRRNNSGTLGSYNKIAWANDIPSAQNLSNSKAGNNVTVNISGGGAGTTFSVADADSVIGNEYQNLGNGTITATTYPITISNGTGITLNGATGSLAGLMVSTDKSKLDGIAPGAEVNVPSNWAETNTSSDAFIQNKPTPTGIMVGNGTATYSGITGTAGQLVRRNLANTAFEFFTPNFLTTESDPIYVADSNILYKYRGGIANGSDMNTFKSGGWYDNGSGNPSGTNYPILKAGFLNVTPYRNSVFDAVAQEYTAAGFFDGNQGRKFLRVSWGGNFSNWREYAFQDWVTSQLNSYVPTSRTITAGNGLTGGGDLTANRTLTLGTPSNITLSSTNSVTGTTHTHAFVPGGTTAQYIRGDGSLATFPTIPAQVNIIAGTGIGATGTYPNITINNTGDLSITNELQNLGLAVNANPALGYDLSISSGNTLNLQTMRYSQGIPANNWDSIRRNTYGYAYDGGLNPPPFGQPFGATAGVYLNFGLHSDYPSMTLAMAANPYDHTGDYFFFKKNHDNAGSNSPWYQVASREWVQLQGFSVLNGNGYVKMSGTTPSYLSTIPYGDLSGAPTIGNGTITLNTSGILSGSTNFTVNQTGNTTFTINAPSLGTTAGTVAAGNDSRFHDAVTLGTANGLSLNNQQISLGLASTSTTGALSSSDWNTFNSKAPANGGTGYIWNQYSNAQTADAWISGRIRANFFSMNIGGSTMYGDGGGFVGFYTDVGLGTAENIKAKSLVASDSYSDAAPTNGLFVKGGVKFNALSGINTRMMVAGTDGTVSTQAIPEDVDQWQADANTYLGANSLEHGNGKGIYTNGAYRSTTQILQGNANVADNVEYILRLSDGSDYNLHMPNPNDYPGRVLKIRNATYSAASSIVINDYPIFLFASSTLSGSKKVERVNGDTTTPGVDWYTAVECQSVQVTINGTTGYQWVAMSVVR